MAFSRRDFLTTTALGSLALGLEAQEKKTQDSRRGEVKTVAGKAPIIVCANNGFNYLDDAFAMLSSGGDTLDAALRVVSGPENDPNDDSVVLVVCPTKKAWSSSIPAACTVRPGARDRSGGVRNIKNVSLVAKAVMEHTGHVMLVGEGAERFAVAMGHPRENLLTDRSRKIWMLWKQFNSDRDWWGPGIADPHWKVRLRAGPNRRRSLA